MCQSSVVLTDTKIQRETLIFQSGIVTLSSELGTEWVYGHLSFFVVLHNNFDALYHASTRVHLTSDNLTQ